MIIIQFPKTYGGLSINQGNLFKAALPGTQTSRRNFPSSPRQSRQEKERARDRKEEKKKHREKIK